MSRREEILTELGQLRERQSKLEIELGQLDAGEDWPPVGYYTAYHLVSGALLGTVAAAISLLFNVIGATMVGKHPLELIRTYLTFPMGETALSMDNSATLAIGCFLYLGTGMAIGALMHVALTRWLPSGDFRGRFVKVSLMVLLLWVVNFYLILSWLQPLLFDGAWIVDGIPWWVAASTHLVFGWTLLLMEPWGRFDRR